MQKQLSVATVYHIRKLLHQNLDRLTSIVASGAGMKADPLSDFRTVLESLYLDEQELLNSIGQLEKLVSAHQSLSQQGAKHRQELRNIEHDIFWLLGFSLREITYHGTILIVDDTLMNIRLLSTALSNHGYEVHSATNGKEALILAKELKPDLIVLDILLPGMDGYEICDRLKSNLLTRDIPVLFVSTMNTATDKIKAFDIGAADYIAKPFQLEEVLARVENQLKVRNLQKRLEEQNVRLQQESQERQQAEALYRSMFENAIYGMFQTTQEGQYLKANLALAHLYGYDSSEELVATVNNIETQLYIDPQRRAEFVAYMKAHDSVSEFESQVYRKDGSIIWISEPVARANTNDGALCSYEGIVRDITKQKQTENAMLPFLLCALS